MAQKTLFDLKKSEVCREANPQRRLTNNRRDWIGEQGPHPWVN